MSSLFTGSFFFYLPITGPEFERGFFYSPSCVWSFFYTFSAQGLLHTSLHLPQLDLWMSTASMVKLFHLPHCWACNVPWISNTTTPGWHLVSHSLTIIVPARSVFFHCISTVLLFNWLAGIWLHTGRIFEWIYIKLFKAWLIWATTTSYQ